MIRKIISGAFSLVVFATMAQEDQNSSSSVLNVGIESNSQWYIDDDKIKLSEIDAQERFRSNNYLKLDYFVNKWEFGTQIESYLPMALLNYSPNLKNTGIGTIYAKYNNVEKGFDFTVGHFYEQFGSGMALRFWEDRQLGINNALFGARVNYLFTSGSKVTALAGKQRIGMGFDLSEALITGLNLDIGLSEVLRLEETELNVGASFVGRYDNQQDVYPTLPKTTGTYSLRADMAQNGFYLGAEYVYKTEDALVEYGTIKPDNKFDGNAIIVNTGYSQKGFGLDVNLRRMENMSFFSDRELAGNAYNTGVLNYIPALTKQYDFALQNIYVYQAQGRTTFTPLLKAGEIGGQFDLYYQFKKGSFLGGKYGTYVAMNGSFWNALKIKEADVPQREVTVGLFDLGRKYYNDIGFETRKKFSEKWQTIFMFVSQYFNQKYVEETFGEHKTQIVAGEVIYKFKDTQSLRVIGQHLWADGDKKNWAGATIEYAPNMKWSFYVHDIYNYGNDNPEVRIHYYSIGGAFVKGATRIGMSYGRQRGGMICVGGVCRLVPESSGFNLNISTNF